MLKDKELFKHNLEIILDEAFAQVNMHREEWDPEKIAVQILNLLGVSTGFNWRPDINSVEWVEGE